MFVNLHVRTQRENITLVHVFGLYSSYILHIIKLSCGGFITMQYTCVGAHVFEKKKTNVLYVFKAITHSW